MPSMNIDSEVISDLKQQKAEINRLETAVIKTESEVTSLCEKITHAQELLHSQRDALSDSRNQFNELLSTVSPGIRDLLRQSTTGNRGSQATVPAATILPSPPLGPREKTQWAYSKLRRRARSQVVLCEMYAEEFGKSAQSLLAFLAASKYFRKGGAAGDFSWSISANRENDLREYLS